MKYPAYYQWRLLEDLPDDYQGLANPELQPLFSVWQEQRSRLDDGESIRVFNEQFERRWAIETGVIEQTFTLDRGITELLIEHGIDASLIPSDSTNKDPELVAAIIQDHQSAMEGLFDFVARRRPLSTSYIKELHALMTRHQETCTAVDTLGRRVEVPLLRGEYKEQPDNPKRPDGSVHEYCPPEHVASEMDRLVAYHLDHEEKEVQPDVEAAWLHHRFVQIHPFQDGNGRVARALASLIFVRANWFPLIITRDDREAYINALEIADRGELGLLVKLFGSVEKKAFIGALSIVGDISQRQKVDQVIDATRELLRGRREKLWAEWEKAKELAAQLQEDAHTRFSEVRDKIEADLGPDLGRHDFFVDEERAGGGRSQFFLGQIIGSAKRLGYYANLSTYASWLRLVLRTENQSDILLSFQGIGFEYRGVLGASMTFFRRTETEEGDREVTDEITVSPEVFQFNYREDEATVRLRFGHWLEENLVHALEIWRAGL